MFEYDIGDDHPELHPQKICDVCRRKLNHAIADNRQVVVESIASFKEHSNGQIMKMLTTDFMKLVFIANIFAWPITYILAKDWLAIFSYQIDMPILPYVFATILAMIIALITVSSQAFYAANSDPVNALKYE